MHCPFGWEHSFPFFPKVPPSSVLPWGSAHRPLHPNRASRFQVWRGPRCTARPQTTYLPLRLGTRLSDYLIIVNSRKPETGSGFAHFLIPSTLPGTELAPNKTLLTKWMECCRAALSNRSRTRVTYVTFKFLAATLQNEKAADAMNLVIYFI